MKPDTWIARYVCLKLLVQILSRCGCVKYLHFFSIAIQNLRMANVDMLRLFEKK
jgi:hypothetical protein